MKAIITSDDFGKSSSRNKAIDYAFKNQICSEASLMVNYPAFNEACDLAYQSRYQDAVAFHLNLTEGKPITEDVKATPLCVNGEFKKTTPKVMLMMLRNSSVMDAIEKECEAQISLFRAHGFNSRHFDAHHWIACEYPIWKAVSPLLKKYDFDSIRPLTGHKLDSSAGKMKIYYKYVNKRISKSGFSTIQWSGCVSEFLSEFNNIKKHDIVPEVFIHPDMINNHPCDTVFSYGSGINLSLDVIKPWFDKIELVTFDGIVHQSNR